MIGNLEDVTYTSNTNTNARSTDHHPFPGKRGGGCTNRMNLVTSNLQSESV